MPPPPPGPGPETSSPFADRARVGFIAGFFETWKLVATQPAQFFSRVRIDQAWSAVLFGVIAWAVGSTVAVLFGWVSGQQATIAIQQMVEKLPEEQGRFLQLWSQAFSARAMVAQIVFTPVVAFVAIYVTAAVVHLLLMLVRGATRGFDATLTTVAYVSGLNLLLAVPACGSLIAIVWSTVALIIGLSVIHRCGVGKAAAAVLAPGLIVCVCACAALGLGLAPFLKGAEEASKGVQTTHL
jgi:hypothetical protein